MGKKSDLVVTVSVKRRSVIENGAGDRIRTGDVQLGKLAFYH